MPYKPDAYPENHRAGGAEYPRDRQATTTARISGAATLAAQRAELESSRPFDIGPGGVKKLTEELKAAGEHVAILPGRKRVVGNESPRDASIATFDSARFAPKGSPRDVLKLRALVLEGDTATGVVTRERGEGNTKVFDVSLVRLGVGQENPERDGYTGTLVAQRTGLGLAQETLVALGKDTHYVDGGTFKVGFMDGQLTVEPGETEGISVMTAAEMGLTAGASDLAGRLERNTLMWNPANADHHAVPGMS
jgi:hypothetical protein